MNPQHPAFTRLLLAPPAIRIQSGSIRRRIRCAAGEIVLGNKKRNDRHSGTNSYSEPGTTNFQITNFKKMK
jgi:hypothetical protein